MNPFYIDRLYSVLRGMGLREQPDDRKRMHQAITEDDVYDVLVNAFGADRVHEATLQMEKRWPTVFIERAVSVSNSAYSHAQRLHHLLCTMQRQVRLETSDAIRLFEASEEVAIGILREAYGAEAVDEAERKLAKIRQAVEDKEREILAAKVAKTQPTSMPAGELEAV